MSVIRNTVSIAANGSNSDQLQTDGVPLETRGASQDGVLSLMATESAADILISLFVDGKRMVIDAKPVVKATGPVFPDDIIAQVPIAAGQIVSMSTRNTTGGALTLNYALDIP